MMRKFSAAVLCAVLALSPVLSPAAPAHASAPPDKAAVLAAWTRPGADSYGLWNEARLHPGRWSAYDFIWTSDNCTGGPDQPAGFDFRLSCRRHDFGYRNYQAIGGFKANRARLDQAFHADMRRQCKTYAPAARALCGALAWTYYQAARRYGGRPSQQ